MVPWLNKNRIQNKDGYEKGLSSEERQEGIYFAKNLEEIIDILVYIARQIA